MHTLNRRGLLQTIKEMIILPQKEYVLSSIGVFVDSLQNPADFPTKQCLPADTNSHADGQTAVLFMTQKFEVVVF